MHNALRYGSIDVEHLLIKKSANYDIADNSGVTPAEIVAEKGYETVLDLMVL